MFSSDQWKQADSLHWFESVETNLNQEKQSVERKRATERDEKLQNTLTLKLKRIETTLREFQLLHFNVNSARIFFQVRICFMFEFLSKNLARRTIQATRMMTLRVPSLLETSQSELNRKYLAVAHYVAAWQRDHVVSCFAYFNNFVRLSLC